MGRNPTAWRGPAPRASLVSRGTALAVAFSPEGRLLAAGGPGPTVELWDVGDPGRPQRMPGLAGHPRGVAALAFGPDGRHLAAGGRDGTVRVWDLADRELPPGLEGHDGGVTAVAFSPDGRYLAAGGRDATVVLWDLTERPHPARVGTAGDHHRGGVAPVSCLDFSPHGRLLAVGHRTPGPEPLLLWDVTDPTSPNRLAAPVRVPGWVRRALGNRRVLVRATRFSPDGRFLAAAGTGMGVASYGGYTLPEGMGFLALWDLNDPQAPHRTSAAGCHGSIATAVAFAPDGRRVATTGTDRRIVLWDLTEQGVATPATVLRGHRRMVQSVAFSPDGHLLASAGSDAVRLWQTASPAGDLPVPQQPVPRLGRQRIWAIPGSGHRDPLPRLGPRIATLIVGGLLAMAPVAGLALLVSGAGDLNDGIAFAARARSSVALVQVKPPPSGCTPATSPQCADTTYTASLGRYDPGTDITDVVDVELDHPAAPGDVIPVFYDPDDPFDIRLDTGQQQRSGGIISLVGGGVLVGLPAAALALARGRRRCELAFPGEPDVQPSLPAGTSNITMADGGEANTE